MLPFKVPNDQLLEAGLRLMAQNGHPLERAEIRGRAMLYRTQEGRTVRVRTCNDHVLVAVADSPKPDAKLNLEGTDDVLVVMPEFPRSPGPVVAYLIPTPVVVEAVRSAHRDWLASNPSTHGDNKTWAIWFENEGPSKSNGFAQKWSAYRLQGLASTGTSLNRHEELQPAIVTSLGGVIADAKRRIAAAAGVPESAVKITVDLS
jgi:hypothetical protein